jgi:hypothetical protein
MGRGVKKFVKFPEMWRVQLAGIRANGCAYRMALHLLERAHWMSPGNRQVTLSTTSMRKLGVNRQGKRSALQQLRKAGLIAVEERPKKSPIVTVRFVD